jgi:Phage integrase, N-terminal SAM-like domain
MACVRKYRDHWVVDWRDSNKKRHIDLVTDEAEGHRRLAEITENDRKAPTNESFQAYAEGWLRDYAKGNVKNSTYEEYERALRVHLYPVFGALPFKKIDRQGVKKLIAQKRSNGLSRSSIRNMIAPLRAMYEEAIENEEFHKKIRLGNWVSS